MFLYSRLFKIAITSSKRYKQLLERAPENKLQDIMNSFLNHATNMLDKYLPNYMGILENYGYPEVTYTVLQEIKQQINQFREQQTPLDKQKFIEMLEKIINLEKKGLLIDQDEEQIRKILSRDFYALRKEVKDNSTMKLYHFTNNIEEVILHGVLRPGGNFFHEDILYFLTAFFKYRIKILNIPMKKELKEEKNFSVKEQFEKIFVELEKNKPFCRYYIKTYGGSSLREAVDGLIQTNDYFENAISFLENGGIREWRDIATYFYSSKPTHSNGRDFLLILDIPKKYLVGKDGSWEWISFFPISLHKYCTEIEYNNSGYPFIRKFNNREKLLMFMKNKYPKIKITADSSDYWR
jgi:hypothetical protein